MTLDFIERCLLIQGDKIPFLKASGSFCPKTPSSSNPKSHLQTLMEMGEKESAPISAIGAAQETFQWQFLFALNKNEIELMHFDVGNAIQLLIIQSFVFIQVPV